MDPGIFKPKDTTLKKSCASTISQNQLTIDIIEQKSRHKYYEKSCKKTQTMKQALQI